MRLGSTWESVHGKDHDIWKIEERKELLPEYKKDVDTGVPGLSSVPFIGGSMWAKKAEFSALFGSCCVACGRAFA
jgi:hypothetical protein